VRISPRDYWQLLAVYLRPLWRRTALLAVLMLANIGLQLVSPLVLRRFIDRALDVAPLRTLLVIAGLYIAFALLIQASRLLETWTAEYVGWTATNNLRADLALHVLRLDMGFHNRFTPGALIERVDGDIFTLGNFFSRFIINIIGNGLLGLGVVVLLFRIDWRIGLTIAAFALVTVLIMLGLGRFATTRFAASRQATANLMGFIEERINGTEDIRSAGATGYVMRRNYELSRDLLHKQTRANVVSGLTLSSSNVLFAVGTAISLGVGAVLFHRGAVTLGTVFVIFQYTQILVQPVEEISRQLRDLQQASASIGRVRELQAIQPAIGNGRGLPLPPGALDVTFDHVTFGYAEDEPTVRDVSFHLAPRTVLGLVGRTGSGKTTITRLLFRLYDPDHGSVRLGGVDLRDASQDEIRSRVALVTQEIQLFRATLRDNLTLFDRTIPDRRIIAALRTIGLGEWFDGLLNGLDTMLAAGGGGLSAGESQLLAFTRVFLRDPDLVILDEASSRLDPATEAKLERAIDTLLAGRTAIVIAHRLATIERADRVMVMANGEIAELGDRAALASDPTSRFAGMLRTGSDLIPSEGARA
jgi:ABC-type multidrug transport system fused ATPase/permease subunit